jgi:hypothetical protein
MQPACIEVLARQHLAELRVTRMSGRCLAGVKPAPVRQRLGWVLVQVGLRLAVR